MYDMNDLFNSRDVVGCKLNQIIGSHKYTKSNVCTGAGISRPTLDKLLNGEVTNKTNFEKHISKLLAFLSLTPSELMGGIANPFTDSKTLRDQFIDNPRYKTRLGFLLRKPGRVYFTYEVLCVLSHALTQSLAGIFNSSLSKCQNSGHLGRMIVRSYLRTNSTPEMFLVRL